MIGLFALHVRDCAAQRPGRKVHVRVADEQPLAARALDATLQSVHLAEPAFGQRVDVLDHDSRVARGDGVGDCARTIARTIVDHDHLEFRIAVGQARDDRRLELGGFVASRDDRRHARPAYERCRTEVAELGYAGNRTRYRDEARQRVRQGTRHGEAEDQEHAWRYWGDADFALPDGESNRACAARMVQAVDQLAAQHPGEILAVASHGNALALYLSTIDRAFGYAEWRAMRNPDLFCVQYENGRATWDGARLPTSQ